MTRRIRHLYSPRMNRTHIGCLGAIVLALVLVGGGIWWAYHISISAIRNSYAVWWVADIVVVHMQQNDGAWPRGWEDLRKPYQTRIERTRDQAWTFEELRGRVEIDWAADPTKLAQATPVKDKPPFRVIWLRDGSSVYWQGKEPNRMILAYLKDPYEFTAP